MLIMILIGNFVLPSMPDRGSELSYHWTLSGYKLSDAKLTGMVGAFFLCVAPALIIVSALFRKTSDRVKHEMRLAHILADIKRYRARAVP
jgi:hypothetical protein